MADARAVAVRRLVGIGAAVLTVVACDSKLVPTKADVGKLEPRMFITPDSDSIAAGSCTFYDLNHCAFLAVSHQDLDWLQQAADETTCPYMRSWMEHAIQHGWLHKTDETTYMGMPWRARRTMIASA
jgi:hypothetical protein